MKRTIITFLFSLCLLAQATAQTVVGGTAKFDRMVHDFGDVTVSDGPLSCTFKLENVSREDLSIAAVLTSCGCTDAKWTREAIAPGKSGQISVTYSNDEGPYPFDKTLTVYLSSPKKPVVLHIRGVVHQKAKPISEAFPVHYGALGVRSSEVKGGNIIQGEKKSGAFRIANVSGKSIKVDFRNLSAGLVLKPQQITLKPSETADIEFTLSSSRELWGKNWYYFTPYVNGAAVRCSGKPEDETAAAGADAIRSDPNPELKTGSSRMGVWGITKEGFAGMSKEDRRNGAVPKFEESTFTFPSVKAGKSIDAHFSFVNEGKKELVIYKVDCESLRVKVPAKVSAVAPGGKSSLDFSVDTAGLPKGEQLFLITLYTNSPLRPMVNLYITGFIL